MVWGGIRYLVVSWQIGPDFPGAQLSWAQFSLNHLVGQGIEHLVVLIKFQEKVVRKMSYKTNNVCIIYVILFCNLFNLMVLFLLREHYLDQNQ